MGDKPLTLDIIIGGDGGYLSEPIPTPGGSLVLKLTLDSLIRDWLQSKVDEINHAETYEEQQALIEIFPPIFREALVFNESHTKPLTPGEASAQGNILLVSGYPASHVFDITGGVAFIGHGWAIEGSVGGHYCHMLRGTFEPHELQGGGWIALDAQNALISVYDGPERPDGTRENAKLSIERSLSIKIP